MTTPAPLQLSQNILVQDSAKFTAAWVMNYREIFSHGAVEVNQRIYHPLHKVVALGLLKQTVDGPIVIQEALQTAGGLALTSRTDKIVVLAPVTVAGDLSLQSRSDIEVYKRVAAAGKGRLVTAAPVFLAHTQVYFGGGLDAVSSTFILLASDLDVVGDVRLSGGQLELLSVVHPQHHIAYSFPQISSNLRVDGNFTLDGPLFNKGSLLAVTGEAALRGRVELINDTHIHRYAVEVGTCARRICGINTGKKKRLYAQVEQIIVDGNPARIEVGSALQLGHVGMPEAPLKNEGIILAHRIHGTVSSLHNGLFSGRGRAPQNISAASTLFPGMTFPSLGQIRSLQSTDLKVVGLLHNRGVMQGGNRLALDVGSLVKERYMTDEMTQVAKVRSWGRVKAVGAQESYVGPAENMSGDVVSITIERDGISRGGEIEAGRSLQIQGKGSYRHEALKVQKVVRLNAGIWGKAPTHTTHTSFIASHAYSAGTMEIDLLGVLNIFASSFASWGAMTVFAAEISLATGFGANLTMSKAGVVARKRLFEIIQQHSEIFSVAGPLWVEARSGSFSMEGGRVGSFGGAATVRARDNITFSAAALTAENKVRSTSVTPTTFSHNVTSYNVSGVSLPEFFAGTDGVLAAGQAVRGTGVQLLVGADLTVAAKEIRLRKYSVPRYWTNQGESVSIKFFLSEIVDAVLMNTSLSSAFAATLLRDPAISALYSLVQARCGAEYASKSFLAVTHTWNAAVTLARARNEGKLSSTIADRFGLREFSIRFGSNEWESTWSDSYMTNISVGGDLLFLAPLQHFSDVQGHIGRDATFSGRELIWDTEAEQMHQDSSSGGVTFGFGPSGFSVGMDVAESSSDGKSHKNSHFNIGRHLSIPAAETITLHGAVLDADSVAIKAKKVVVASPVNTFSQNHWSGALSTAGNVSYSEGNSRQEAIEEPSTIRTRSAAGGASLLAAQELDIVGGVIDGGAVEAEQVRGKDIALSSSSSGFALSLDVKELANTIQGTPSQGMQLLGSFDFHQQKQKSVTRATITSAGSKRYPAINSDRSRVQQKGKAKKIEFSIPIIAINSALVQQEAQQIQRAFKPVAPPQAVAAPSAPIQLPQPQAAEPAKLQVPAKAISAKKPAKAVSAKKPAKKVDQIHRLAEQIQSASKTWPESAFGQWSSANSPKKSPAIVPLVEKAKKYVSGGMSPPRPGKMSQPRPSVLSLVWDVWERKYETDMRVQAEIMMLAARGVAILDHTITAGIVKAVKFVPEATAAVCHSHPLLESSCRKVEEHFIEKKQQIQLFGSIVKVGAGAVQRDFRKARENNPKLEQNSLIVQALYSAAASQLKSGYNYAASNIKALAAYQVQRYEQLGIPRKKTEQFHQDLQSVALMALVSLKIPAAAASKVPGTSLVLWKAPRAQKYVAPASSIVPAVPARQLLLPKPPQLALPSPAKALAAPAPMPKPLPPKTSGIYSGLTSLKPSATAPTPLPPKTPSTGFVLVNPIGKLAENSRFVSQASQPPLLSHVSGGKRYSYAIGYQEAAKNFIDPPKEFFGKLSRKLKVFQFHTIAPVNPMVSTSGMRTFQWFMPVCEGNKCWTLEELYQRAALLTRWGERTHVSVAEIPAGKPVRFLHGRAAKQIDTVTGEISEGGGVQYRFFDFDPTWIIETRDIPGAIRVPVVIIPEVRKVCDAAYEKIAAPKKGLEGVQSAIDEAIHRLEPLLTDYSPQLIDSRDVKNIWLLAITGSDSSAKISRMHTIKRKSGSSSVIRLSQGKESYIIKTFERWGLQPLYYELLGLDFLCSLQLKHLHIPEPLAVGTFKDDRADAFFAKSYLPGKPLDVIARNIGKAAVGSSARLSSVKDFTAAAKAAGKALGELHNKGLAHNHPVSPVLVELLLDVLKNELRYANIALSDVNLPQIIGENLPIKVLRDGMQKDPGLASYGFVDISLGQFIWASEAKSLGFCDAEFVTSSFDLARKPLIIPAREYHVLLNEFLAGGLVNGMSHEEIQAFNKAFSTGYLTQVPQEKLSVGADKFYHLFSDLETIKILADGLANGESIDPAVIQFFIDKLPSN